MEVLYLCVKMYADNYIVVKWYLGEPSTLVIYLINDWIVRMLIFA